MFMCNASFPSVNRNEFGWPVSLRELREAELCITAGIYDPLMTTKRKLQKRGKLSTCITT